MKTLLRRGGNPNEQTPKGRGLLQLAIKTGLDKIVKVLVASGAEIDVKDRSGLTPFQVAVAQENKVLADFFLAKGRKRISALSGF